MLPIKIDTPTYADAAINSKSRNAFVLCRPTARPPSGLPMLIATLIAVR